MHESEQPSQQSQQSFGSPVFLPSNAPRSMLPKITDLDWASCNKWGSRAYPYPSELKVTCLRMLCEGEANASQVPRLLGAALKLMRDDLHPEVPDQRTVGRYRLGLLVLASLQAGVGVARASRVTLYVDLTSHNQQKLGSVVCGVSSDGSEEEKLMLSGVWTQKGGTASESANLVIFFLDQAEELILSANECLVQAKEDSSLIPTLLLPGSHPSPFRFFLVWFFPAAILQA